MIINDIEINYNNELEIKKIVQNFGIEILNLDIYNSKHLSQLPNLLDKYKIIIIKNKYINIEEQIELANYFGEVTIAHPVIPGNNLYPEIYEIDGEKGGKNAKWHTDVTFLENPHSISILIADEIPSTGGDTLWCDLESAYNKLNNNFKLFLNTLEAVHKIAPLAYWGFPFDYLKINNKLNKLYDDSKKIVPVSHPVIRIHEKTKNPCIFVNPGYTSHILNVSEIESDNILKLLYEHMTKPEFTIRHKWDKNDIVIWDNKCTAHYAVNDYKSEKRKMRRVTIKGKKVYGFNNLKSKKIENIFDIER